MISQATKKNMIAKTTNSRMIWAEAFFTNAKCIVEQVCSFLVLALVTACKPQAHTRGLMDLPWSLHANHKPTHVVTACKPQAHTRGLMDKFKWMWVGYLAVRILSCNLCKTLELSINKVVTHKISFFPISWITNYYKATSQQGRLGSQVVSVLDSGAEGPGFKSQSLRCRVTVLGKLFTPIVPLFTKQQNW